MVLHRVSTLREALRAYMTSEAGRADPVRLAKAKLFLRELEKVPVRMASVDILEREKLQKQLDSYVGQVEAFLSEPSGQP